MAAGNSTHAAGEPAIGTVEDCSTGIPTASRIGAPTPRSGEPCFYIALHDVGKFKLHRSPECRFGRGFEPQARFLH